MIFFLNIAWMIFISFLFFKIGQASKNRSIQAKLNEQWRLAFRAGVRNSHEMAAAAVKELKIKVKSPEYTNGYSAIDTILYIKTRIDT